MFRCLVLATALTASAVSAQLVPAPATAAEAALTLVVPEQPYTPTPENLAARQWFRDAQFGVFIHWGVYSVLGRGEWVMNNEQIPAQEYEKLCGEFNPTKFNAAQWVTLFKKAGAKYITITSKHHDGFAMFNAQTGDWDIGHRTKFGRDPLKELADECARQDMKLFFYYSQVDWHHPDYFPHGKTGLTAGRPESGDFLRYLGYMNAQLTELLSGDYGPVAGIWFDGWWDQQSKRFEDTKDADPRATRLDWHLRRTYDLIHALQPSCLIGSNHHLAPFAGEDFQMFEQDLPGQNKGGHSRDAKIGTLPLETCDTMNRSWGYNAGDKNFKSDAQLIRYLVSAAGNDANFLLNVGPRPNGTIDPDSAERLTLIGQWLSKYEPTVRPTRRGPVAPQAWGVTTQHEGKVYLHLLDASAADPDGWITLTGTENVEFGKLHRFIDKAPVTSRRNEQGLLQVQVLANNEIDVVLVGTAQ